VARPVLEVADIFRAHGPAWREANAGHVSLGQLKVMSAIESCRTAAPAFIKNLGHVARCEDCAHEVIAYNSCRNRHCPKCQGAAARAGLAEREAELLPVPYYHLVFTLPAAVAYHNKATVYDLLFKASSETLMTIAADPKHLGARVGAISVLHTWGSALTHHPHVHIIAPGGGLSLDGQRWVACRPGFFLPVRVLSRLFRRLFLEKLLAAFDAGQLRFRGAPVDLSARDAFTAFLAPLRKVEWVVYSKRPFGGPEAVLAYLARYTHRVAIANSRLIALQDGAVTFKWKDYRLEGRDRQKTMTLPVSEFIRRFLIPVLPSGFHRIRHYGLFASGARAQNIARARQLLTTAAQARPNNAADSSRDADVPDPPRPCPLLRRPHDHSRDVRRGSRSAPRFPQPHQDRHVMIDFEPPPAPQTQTFSPLTFRRRGQPLCERRRRSPCQRRRPAKSDQVSVATSVIRSLNTANPRSTVTSSARSRQSASLKSP
jgi:hypothetical protein